MATSHCTHRAAMILDNCRSTNPFTKISYMVMNHAGGRRLKLLLGLSICFLSLLVFAAHAGAQTKPPVLISESTSTRAIALDAVTFTREPFALSTPIPFAPDRRTRVMLFALNLPLKPGDDLSSLSAEAEDAAHRRYELKIEYVAPLPNQQWLSAVVIRLGDDMNDLGDVLVRVTYHNQASNRVRMAIGHVGGGPIDDAGTVPTPAVSYTIRGRATTTSAGLGGVTVSLNGAVALSTITDENGNYSLLAPTAGNYLLTATKPFFDFTPTVRALTSLSSDVSGADFNAIRRVHAVSGYVRDESGRALPDITLSLKSNDGEPTQMTTASDNSGRFAFLNLPSGFSYTITPADTNIFTFTPQSTGQLNGDLQLNIRGARRRYAIGGHVQGQAGGLGGVAITLRETGRSAITDAQGDYYFAGLEAGFTYTVETAKADYIFEPPVRSINLDADRHADFIATVNIVLSGRVTDSSGNGVFGIILKITGAHSGTTFTRSDGTYSLVVTRLGGYTVTPTEEQGFRKFTPESQYLTDAPDRRRADFTTTLSKTSTPSYVLEFDGTPKTVDYGVFWTTLDDDAGPFFWEFWAMPDNNAAATYLLSDGYGGAHALLFGFSNLGTSEPGRYQLFGNIWSGKFNYFSSDEGPAPREWGHFAVGWDGKNIVTYLNGVPVGKTAFLGPRLSPGPGWGSGRLFIGGSDHNNLNGRIAQVRGYEGRNPREENVGSNAGSIFSSFAPQTVFSVDGNLLSYFFRPAGKIADLSLQGYNGTPHTGLLLGTANGILGVCPDCPLPQFVQDPTAPDFSNPSAPGQPPAPVDNPRAVPSGALIFDSFSRRNSTYTLGGRGGLGNIEGGAFHGQPWLTNEASSQLQPFGILNGRAVLLANKTSVAWIATGSSTGNLDIQVDRHPGYWGSGHNTGLSFRVVDSSNYFFAYTSDGADPAQPQALTVGYYEAGRRTDLGALVQMPASWTTLRVVTNIAGGIRVYADGALVYSASSPLFATADSAGLYNNTSGLGLTNRWDNFTVFASAQP